jgi:hypothetical protein
MFWIKKGLNAACLLSPAAFLEIARSLDVGVIQESWSWIQIFILIRD